MKGVGHLPYILATNRSWGRLRNDKVRCKVDSWFFVHHASACSWSTEPKHSSRCIVVQAKDGVGKQNGALEEYNHHEKDEERHGHMHARSTPWPWWNVDWSPIGEATEDGREAWWAVCLFVDLGVLFLGLWCLEALFAAMVIIGVVARSAPFL